MGKRKNVHIQMPKPILYAKEEAFSFSIRLCSSWSITIECKHRFTLAKAKLLMMLNLTTTDHYVNDSDIVSITSIKARIRIDTQ